MLCRSAHFNGGPTDGGNVLYLFFLSVFLLDGCHLLPWNLWTASSSDASIMRSHVTVSHSPLSRTSSQPAVSVYLHVLWLTYISLSLVFPTCWHLAFLIKHFCLIIRCGTVAAVIKQLHDSAFINLSKTKSFDGWNAPALKLLSHCQLHLPGLADSVS